MKRITIITLVLLSLLLSGCGPAAPQDSAADVQALQVTGGETSAAYTRADLEDLPVTQAVFNEVTYTGVTVSTLLEETGFDLAQIKAVKAVASDGYSVNYDTAQLLVPDVIVAYARAEGELTEEDGNFRMVLPGAEGKLNICMLQELQVIQ